MAARVRNQAVKTQSKYRQEIVERMQAVGTYREEFAPIVDRTAGLYVQLDRFLRDFEEKAGGQAVIKHTNKSGATNLVKNPLLAACESVYGQLILHERELGLTPTGLKKLNEAALAQNKTSNALVDALKELDI